MGGLVAEAKELCEKVEEQEKADVASRTASNGCKKRNITAGDKRVLAFGVEFAKVKPAHALVGDVASQS